MTTLILEVSILLNIIIFFGLAWWSDSQNEAKKRKAAEIEREIEKHDLKYRALYGRLRKR